MLASCIIVNAVHQIKRGVSTEVLEDAEANFSIVFIYVRCQEKGCCRVVSEGRLGQRVFWMEPLHWVFVLLRRGE